MTAPEEPTPTEPTVDPRLEEALAKLQQLDARLSTVEGELGGVKTAVTAIEERVEAIETQVGPDDPDPVTPTGIPIPRNFTCTLNSSRQAVTKWADPEGAQTGDKIEVHELEVDPTNTLKATIDLGVGQRISGTLAGGKNYTYVLRTKRMVDGKPTYSAWTQRITLYVPASGETTTPTSPVTPTSPTTPTTPTSPTTHKFPTDILPELKTWTIMTTTGTQGDPDNDYYIAKDIANVFYVDSDGGVVFRADANGFHSPNSLYCRVEGRQMKDANWHKAAWSSSGIHTLECVLAFDTSHLNFRRVNGMQIHDGGDDVCQIMRHESLGLGFMHNDGKSFVSIDPSYQDGKIVTVKIEAANNVIRVYYNGVKKVEVPKTGSGWYWKVGCYNQTGGAKVERPEPKGNYGQVKVYKLVTTGGAA